MIETGNGYAYRSPFNLICDFDGTISSVDSTDLILSRFAPLKWEEVERQWEAGLISARECMFRQVGMLKVTRESLNHALDEIPLTPGFAQFAAFAENHGLKPRIVSDGLDYVIKRILAAHRLKNIPIVANRLVFTEQGLKLEFPYSRSTCGSGVCKCAAAEAPGPMILIGDGRSDLCLADRADFVLARQGQSLERHCLANGLPFASYQNFYDIIDFFEKILDRPHLTGLGLNSRHPAGLWELCAVAPEIKP